MAARLKLTIDRGEPEKLNPIPRPPQPTYRELQTQLKELAAAYDALEGEIAELTLPKRGAKKPHLLKRLWQSLGDVGEALLLSSKAKELMKRGQLGEALRVTLPQVDVPAETKPKPRPTKPEQPRARTATTSPTPTSRKPARKQPAPSRRKK